VIITTRSEQKATETLAKLQDLGSGKVSAETVDLSDLQSVFECTERLQKLRAEEEKLILVANAGVMVPPATKTAEGLELMFGVNHIGHFAFVNELVPITKRVVIVSSMAVSMAPKKFEWNDYVTLDKGDGYSFSKGSWKRYGVSKLANYIFAQGLKKRFPDMEVAVAHPGYTSTNLQKSTAFRIFNGMSMSSDQGVLSQVRAAVEEDLSGVGQQWFAPHNKMSGFPILTKEGLPPLAFDSDFADQLWNLSQEIVNKQKK
jgi:NAD(P)-dependent dehydrogenase (short-subunit alcohol dehydrogenase family)